MPRTPDGVAPCAITTAAAEAPSATAPSAASATAQIPSRPARRIAIDRQGPILIEGPVEIVLADGTLARSDRFMVAVCMCRRSRAYPWCDTSHRSRERAVAPAEDGRPR
ncbi:CDGSH iron-sulfur domain-containing protein [Streptomyces sp. NPDC056747]|uniref:CDGSH iron-sulfur domain-containing protein n=1 Tax=Streptomyces sp. NPDC056747 TaxID=3345935 RepID=UPI003674AEB5